MARYAYSCKESERGLGGQRRRPVITDARTGGEKVW